MGVFYQSYQVLVWPNGKIEIRLASKPTPKTAVLMAVGNRHDVEDVVKNMLRFRGCQSYQDLAEATGRAESQS